MTKSELIDLADRHGMSILRDPITNEAWGLALETEQDIPELDALAADIWAENPVAVEKVLSPYQEAHGTHLYKVTCPVEWFDILGWSDD